MCIAAIELMRRIEDIYRHFPGDYLNADVLREKGPYFTVNDRSDPHYRHYKLVSTLYRFCSFLGWVELYRREVMTLPASAVHRRSELEKRLDSIRISLADGQIQTADDWESWTDRLIFCEELRGIGEQMIMARNRGRRSSVTLGFAKSCAAPNNPNGLACCSIFSSSSATIPKTSEKNVFGG